MTLRRRKELRSNPETQRAWERRTRQPLPAKSARRKDEEAERARVRTVVLKRAGHRCQYADVVPEVLCGFLPERRSLEVDELRGGSYRHEEYLDPDQCRAVCPKHHDYKTAHKNEVLARLAIHEGRA